jgi:hypothetical protein
MIIIGVRPKANSLKAIIAVRDHTGKSLAESKRLIEQALEGQTVLLPDDFVLREDLEYLGFKLK